MLYEKSALRNFAKFKTAKLETAKTPVPESFFNKVASVRLWTTAVWQLLFISLSRLDDWQEVLLNIWTRSFSGSVFSRAECCKD